jgi:hypothetical protein
MTMPSLFSLIKECEKYRKNKIDEDNLRKVNISKKTHKKIYYVPSNKLWEDNQNLFFEFYETISNKYGCGIFHRFSFQDFQNIVQETNLNILPGHNPNFIRSLYLMPLNRVIDTMIEKNLLKKLNEEDF